MTPVGQVTVDAIREALAGKQSSTLVALTTLLDALTAHGETVSLVDLSALINCDSRLVARVLALVNSVEMRPGAAPVTSITAAFHVLGISQLRTLVLSALLAQHADTANHAQREMAVLSLASGLVAQSLAELCGEDPEQAFLCGSLRNYGNLLLSTFRPADFDLALAEATGGRDKDAPFIRVFGLSAYELAAEMLASTGLPRNIVAATSHPTDATPRERNANPLLNVALCSLAFIDLLFDPTTKADVFRKQALALLGRFLPAAVPSDAALNEFLEVQRRAFEAYARFVEFAAIANRPIVSITRRISNADLFDCSVVATRPRVHAIVPAVPPAAPKPITSILAEDIPRIAEAYAAADVLLFGLDAVLGTFRMTQGVGELSKRLRGASLFAANDAHILGVCVSSRRLIAVYDISQGKTRGIAPSWMQQPPAPISFVLLPLGGTTIQQVLLVGWQSPRKAMPHSVAEVLNVCSAGRKATQAALGAA